MERGHSRYESDIAYPFSLPSEQTAARMEMRKSNSWRESWYGDATGTTHMPAQAFNHSARTLFGSIWHDEGTFRDPSQAADKSGNLIPEMYYYRGYASAITAVGATSVAAMAAPAGETPIQKISGRQGSDWWEENPGNPGDTSNESPVGEPMVLLLFAFGLAVYRYQEQHISKTKNIS